MNEIFNLLSWADIIGITAFITTALVGAIAVPVWSNRKQRARQLNRRLNTVSAFYTDEEIKEAETSLIREDQGDDGSTEWQKRLEERIECQFGMIGGVTAVRHAAIMGAILTVLTTALLSSLLGLTFLFSLFLAIGIGALGAVSLLFMRQQKARDLFLKYFPDVIDMVVRTSRAGIPISEAMHEIANEMEAPIGPEFARIASEISIGVPLDETLRTALKRIDLHEFKFFAITLMLQRETGGQLTETLENLSDLLRKRQHLRGKINSMTAEPRVTAKIIAVAPFVLFALLYSMNPERMMLLFNDPMGVSMIKYALISLVLGGIVLNRLVKIKV